MANSSHAHRSDADELELFNTSDSFKIYASELRLQHTDASGLSFAVHFIRMQLVF